jgi:hypothetical protein
MSNIFGTNRKPYQCSAINIRDLNYRKLQWQESECESESESDCYQSSRQQTLEGSLILQNFDVLDEDTRLLLPKIEQTMQLHKDTVRYSMIGDMST